MTLSSQLQSSTSLLEAARAAGNWRALLLWSGSVVAAFAVGGLLALAGAPLLGALAAVAVLFYGTNAVGILLMDACRVGVSATPGDAIRRSLASSHRVLGVALTAFGGLLLLVLVVAVALYICKIPFLGAILLVAVLPLSALLLGGAALALLYVYLPLAACAVWTGSGVMPAVTRLLAVVRQRLVPVILQEFVLTLIVLVAGAVIGGVLMLGLSITTGLAAVILGPQAVMVSPMLLLGQGGAYALAGFIGVAALLALVGSIPGVILIQGFCQIYLSATDRLASELPAPVGDDTLNTAARLRAAEEAAQAHREAAAPVAPGALEAQAPAATPSPAAPPAPAAESSRPPEVSSASALPASPAPGNTADAPPADAAAPQRQQSLGFDEDTPSAPAPKPDDSGAGPATR